MRLNTRLKNELANLKAYLTDTAQNIGDLVIREIEKILGNLKMQYSNLEEFVSFVKCLKAAHSSIITHKEEMKNMEKISSILRKHKKSNEGSTSTSSTQLHAVQLKIEKVGEMIQKLDRVLV